MVTLKKIAKLTGVHPSTVSRTINNDPDLKIRSDTRARILKAAKELNYHPNVAARNLKKGETKTLGLVISDFYNPVIASIIHGAEIRASKEGYNLLVCGPGQNQSKTISSFIDKSYDGLLISNSCLEDSYILDLVNKKIPLVLINRKVPNMNNFVIVDDLYGITDYLTFAKQVVAEFPDYSISFEVFSNSQAAMLKEAELLHSLGKNVYVKIPIITTDGKSTAPLIHKLSDKGISINVTAIATIAQVKETVAAFAPGTKNIVSIFVGRVADTGVDPTEFVQQSVSIVKEHPEANLLWASTREVLNIFQAQRLGVDIITVPPTIIKKLTNVGKSAQQVSLETVLGFEKDIKASGLKIL